MTAREVPEQLLEWVDSYPAVLIRQPDDVWTHRYTHFLERDDGSITFEIPLWTTDESPSDLTAQIELEADGRIHIYDVHVL
ncbi:DUF7668 domain-containing protein [Kribbella sandramycini]|uniref:DUF7668 domain-containing protein n=1 Tax=Kribbella sandramycini TaxID=60450 RepID=UPI003B51A897